MSIPDTADIPEIIDATQVVDRAFWLRAANRAIRNYCGWHVTPVITQTIRRDRPSSGVLLLPTNKLVSVLSCTSDGVDVLANVEWSENGMLELTCGAWSRRLGGIVVQIEHGYESAPDVAALVATLAARGSSNPAGIISQSIGPANVRYGDIPLMTSEMLTLDPYRLQWGA